MLFDGSHQRNYSIKKYKMKNTGNTYRFMSVYAIYLLDIFHYSFINPYYVENPIHFSSFSESLSLSETIIGMKSR